MVFDLFVFKAKTEVLKNTFRRHRSIGLGDVKQSFIRRRRDVYFDTTFFLFPRTYFGVEKKHHSNKHENVVERTRQLRAGGAATVYAQTRILHTGKTG